MNTEPKTTTAETVEVTADEFKDLNSQGKIVLSDTEGGKVPTMDGKLVIIKKDVATPAQEESALADVPEKAVASSGMPDEKVKVIMQAIKPKPSMIGAPVNVSTVNNEKGQVKPVRGDKNKFNSELNCRKKNIMAEIQKAADDAESERLFKAALVRQQREMENART